MKVRSTYNINFSSPEHYTYSPKKINCQQKQHNSPCIQNKAAEETLLKCILIAPIFCVKREKTNNCWFALYTGFLLGAPGWVKGEYFLMV